MNQLFTGKIGNLLETKTIFFLLSILLFSLGLFLGQVPANTIAELSSGWLTLIFLFISSGFVYYGLFKTIATKKGMLIIFGLIVLSLVIEYGGLVSGFPYGEFSYTDLAGPKIFGVLPLSVGLAWPPLVIGSYFLFQKKIYSQLQQFFYPVLFLVGLDLVIDPAAVRFGLWTWKNGGSYFGVPVQNYFGWLLSGIAGVWLVDKILSEKNFEVNHWVYFAILVNVTFWVGFLLSRGFSFLI
jgi:putative membrane protein